MSWIADHKTTTPGGGEAICRVYGHRLLDGEEILELPPNAMWIPPAALPRLALRLLHRGGREKDEIGMWLNAQDEAGEAVRRGYGVASGDVGWKRSASLTLSDTGRLFRRAGGRFHPLQQPRPRRQRGGAFHVRRLVEGQAGAKPSAAGLDGRACARHAGHRRGLAAQVWCRCGVEAACTST